MLNYMITFFMLGLIAVFIGFCGVAGEFTVVAKLMAVIFLVLFIASLFTCRPTDRKI